MRYRKLDDSGDYSFGKGSADFYANQPEAVAQAVKTRLDLWLGEWFLDTTDGMAWRTKVLGKYTQQAYDAAIQSRILGTDGVTEITAYQSVFDSSIRKLNVTVTINTAYGTTTLSESI